MRFIEYISPIQLLDAGNWVAAECSLAGRWHQRISWRDVNTRPSLGFVGGVFAIIVTVWQSYIDIFH